jgi:hypothetical protein
MKRCRSLECQNDQKRHTAEFHSNDPPQRQTRSKLPYVVQHLCTCILYSTYICTYLILCWLYPNACCSLSGKLFYAWRSMYISGRWLVCKMKFEKHVFFFLYLFYIFDVYFSQKHTVHDNANLVTKGSNAMYIILKILHPGGIRTHDLLWRGRRRWPLHHAATKAIRQHVAFDHVAILASTSFHFSICYSSILAF